MKVKINHSNINRKILHIQEKIVQIDKIEDIKDKTILLLCLLDSYSQLNVFSTEKTNEGKFKEFVLQFYHADYWNEICLINPIYNLDKNKQKEFIIRIRKILGSNLNDLSSLNTNKDILIIRNELKNEYQLLGKNIQKFSYIKLLYKYRSKLIHNYAFPGNCDDIVDEEVARYISRYDTQEGKIQDFYDLVFPYNFIKKLVLISITNYLQRCLKEVKNPFSNVQAKLTWYEE